VLIQEIIDFLLRLGLVIRDQTNKDTISALPDDKEMAALQQAVVAAHVETIDLECLVIWPPFSFLFSHHPL